MNDQQLSFLSTEPAAFDVNAVDDGVIRPVPLSGCSVAFAMSQRSVDDWVFGLGFTNWKTVIDHALQTGHYELYASEDGCFGLRKHGYRYSPIPRLPVGGSTYIQQRLLVIASARNDVRGRQEKMITAAPEFAFKVVIETGCCDLTIKQSGVVIRAGVLVDELGFDDQPGASPQLVEQIARVLANAGAKEGTQLINGCIALAAHLVRIAHGVR